MAVGKLPMTGRKFSGPCCAPGPAQPQTQGGCWDAAGPGWLSCSVWGHSLLTAPVGDAPGWEGVSGCQCVGHNKFRGTVLFLRGQPGSEALMPPILTPAGGQGVMNLAPKPEAQIPSQIPALLGWPIPILQRKCTFPANNVFMLFPTT